MKKDNKEKKASNPVSVMLKLTLAGLLFNIMLIAVYALLVTLCGISENGVSAVALTSTALCAFVSGLGTARSAKNRGLIWGMTAGALFAAVMLIIGYFTTAVPVFGIPQIVRIVIAVACGGLGGVAGIVYSFK
jgi:putative membrane protein (TIGR04086 family)